MHPQTRIFCLVRPVHDSDVDLAMAGDGCWMPVNDLEGRPANTGSLALYPCPELAEQMAAMLAKQGVKDVQVRRVWWPVDEVSRSALEVWFQDLGETSKIF